VAGVVRAVTAEWSPSPVTSNGRDDEKALGVEFAGARFGGYTA
jgi:hypothetical protein